MYSKTKWLRYALAGTVSVNLLSLWTLVRNPRNFKGLLMKMHRAYVLGSGLASWKVEHLLHLFPEIHSTVGVEVNFGGPYAKATPLRENRCLLYVALITKSLSPKIVFEIGTFQGQMTLLLALNSPADCQIFTLDLRAEDRVEVGQYERLDATMIEFLRNNPSEVGSRFRGHPLASKITQLWRDSRTFDFSPWHNKVDLVYVDGAHTYEFVKSDIEDGLKILRPGGTIVFDDFNHLGDNYGVTRAIMDSPIKDRGVQIEDTSFCVYRHSKSAAPI